MQKNETIYIFAYQLQFSIPKMKNKTIPNAVELKRPAKVNKDLRRPEGYEKNPFVVELKGSMYLQPKPNTIIARGEQIVDTTTGEVVEDSVLMGRRKVVDRSEFAKIYFRQIKAIFDLSPTALKVLMRISEKMGYDTMVLFNAKQEAPKLGYKTQQAIQRAIKELLDCGIIAQGYVASMYWVNPLYICKGERFAMYLEYTTKEYAAKSEERRAMIQDQLKEQAAHQMDGLDERTEHSIQAMDKREELADRSRDPERYQREFPGMSGESDKELRKFYQGNLFTGDFEEVKPEESE